MVKCCQIYKGASHKNKEDPINLEKTSESRMKFSQREYRICIETSKESLDPVIDFLVLTTNQLELYAGLLWARHAIFRRMRDENKEGLSIQNFRNPQFPHNLRTIQTILWFTSMHAREI